MARHPEISTLMRWCHGKARGWETLRFGWGQAKGDFPREGWWAITAEGQVYLARDHHELQAKFRNNPWNERSKQ